MVRAERWLDLFLPCLGAARCHQQGDRDQDDQSTRAAITPGSGKRFHVLSFARRSAQAIRDGT